MWLLPAGSPKGLIQQLKKFTVDFAAMGKTRGNGLIEIRNGNLERDSVTSFEKKDSDTSILSMAPWTFVRM